MYADAPINYVVPSTVTSVPALPVSTGRLSVYSTHLEFGGFRKDCKRSPVEEWYFY